MIPTEKKKLQQLEHEAKEMKETNSDSSDCWFEWYLDDNDSFINAHHESASFSTTDPTSNRIQIQQLI